VKTRPVILLASLAVILVMVVALGSSSAPAASATEQGGDRLHTPGVLSLAPPLIAIVMAFVLRSVLPALLLGLWAGVWVLNGLSLRGLFLSLLSVFEEYVPEAIIDPEHAAVILFIMMIGGMIGILTANGGMLAVVEAIQRVAHTRRAGQLMTTGLGFAIFFDDYANTLLVGKTMRPLADRLRVSRQSSLTLSTRRPRLWPVSLSSRRGSVTRSG
jgi:Na+/H+ antiporter NhaC